MIYRAIGLMSGSSLDGLDIAFVEFEESRGQWLFTIYNAETIDFTDVWKQRLSTAAQLSAFDFVQLDNDFGRFIGEAVNNFIERNNLEHRVQLIVSHGHTIFHSPEKYITTQIGNGAQIAALTGINVISDLRSLDVALGGQGAPIVPIGEKYLFKDYSYFLNIGGIANISLKNENDSFSTFDVCVANQVLNYFAQQKGLAFDKDGELASKGNVNTALLTRLNALDYYHQTAPKSLSNQYFRENILPLIENIELSIEDILRTYAEHIVMQITYAIIHKTQGEAKQLLVTGGGALNSFLIDRLRNSLSVYNIEVIIPEREIVEFKEALIMAFLGVLRWREENTVLPGATGASRASIGGAVWMGQEY
ncbi:anhydro-N-acetylmuramic acid kinase [Arachidicoccus ginsenosidimutans]|uniref:anhydro-N-acetylmuramic acid kinase n=1 Tax=Arachidicoccus sp. BS20 TaxID=1850526 RepID=UPI0007F098E8|nr:anhydro-N-acetylmuramic acid kinase [Arachidicoccus sp. BS20]ANI89128.1 anhydro-N-acetylmuramic acid kinase [Arachidicoccus sp. BS20]